uniref:Ig-like domain-containing protein n=1 Tax=Seriola lalandi dorsalis TaxID=1841481 RepID=A0A3B4YCM3_SERLL
GDGCPLQLLLQPGKAERTEEIYTFVLMGSEGDTVTLSCNYSGSVHYLYWYQQKSSSSPQFLIADYSENTPGLSLQHDKKTREFHLNISSAAVTDSAVYYCLTQGGPFPNLQLTPQLGEASGPLLERATTVSLHSNNKKTLYNNCVKVICRKDLEKRTECAWSRRIGDGVAPCWEILYTPPIKKQTAHLQWRDLHGAIACNAVVSVMNPALSNVCPFCGHPETIFHLFIECERLLNFHTLLSQVFSSFNVQFSEKVFIYGSKERKENKKKWQLLNFVSGTAKLAIYVSRGNKVEERRVRTQPQCGAATSAAD